MAQATQIITWTTTQVFETFQDFASFVESQAGLEETKDQIAALRNSSFVVADYFVAGNEATVVRLWNSQEDLDAYRASEWRIAGIREMESWGWVLSET